MMVHRFAACWLPVFSATKRGLADPVQTFETLTPLLVSSLDSAAATAREQRFPDAQINEAMFALVAWMDEAALTTSWCGAASWRQAPLQQRYFSTGRAGVEFFQRLEALPADSQGVREVFGLALLSGFQGAFATRPSVELVRYRRACLRQILAENKVPLTDGSSPLFAHAQYLLPQRSRLNRRGLSDLALTLLTVVPLLLLCGLYEYFDLLLGQKFLLLVRGF
ncbi:DotU/TssL family secretion system protein [Pseudomonas plecoglossicida]|uniref:DotU family type IV/VI secretion system protein n=1 Tax=Pseudomonas plecoglossicida TaxID=70775 RepID=A0AAD0QVH7_PSEDL|nr:DotU/TssL family secretion system protein [Pseudomonas plecoglossicida]AXM95515.1 DotU family type IV/VI secretion system protein [Pseudomonas plecoglossicida]EPB94318.1 hypothetical protein L321_18272 [Pseudomonas plecoglossicida NB2011]QLB56263.1 DotU family type IV/VI secretion system protein [Pseudomonas plecoglossicida]GLR37874.1 hypothetical protein GCM10011247_32720 [Pseudomonas plecoglossicida]